MAVFCYSTFRAYRQFLLDWSQEFLRVLPKVIPVLSELVQCSMGFKCHFVTALASEPTWPQAD